MVFRKEGNNNNNDTDVRSITVYLIRHGEAEHNVEEKLAKKRVIQDQATKGYGPSHEQTARLVEESRKDILLDPQFFDARITNRGKDEAKGARRLLDDCYVKGLPQVQQVLVSPLRRCLATAEEMFGRDSNVQVRVEEDLRERLTGRPADNRMCSERLEELHPRFDCRRLRSLSSSNLMASSMAAETDVSDTSSTCYSGTGSADDDSDVVVSAPSRENNMSYVDLSELLRSTLAPTVPFRSVSSAPRFSSSSNSNRLLQHKGSSLNVEVEVEDDNAVRKRAFRLFQMLNETESNSVAVVTHKGFLRGLERGCFGLSDSPEFTNCEVRVYQINMKHGDVIPNGIHRLN